MSRVSILAAVAAVIVAAVGIFALAGPRSSGGVGGQPIASTPASPARTPATQAPSASPSIVLPALDATFVSRWYGYTVQYPQGWQVTDGEGPWPIGQNLSHGDPHLDQIQSPTGTYRARIVGASVALPDGATLDDFRSFASPQAKPCIELAPLAEPVTIDGVQALMSLNGCHSLSELGGTIYDILVLAGGRGYDFTVDGYLTPADVSTLLAAITLEPDGAPPASASPTP